MNARTRGFTMIEMLIAMVMLSIVMTAAIRFFKAVNTSVNGTVDRMDAMQNLRFALTSLDRELRAAGAGTTDVQPTLVYISPTVVAFNADLVSLIPNSPTAVYYNPDGDPNGSNAVTRAQRFTIPTTSVQYPDSTYRTAGALSPAETVIYYFEADPTTARTDDYRLMRQVNNNAPDLVARNLLAYPGQPFFNWLRTDANGNLNVVVAGSLPMRHSDPLHGALSDTGLIAQIDSIRAVRVNLYATNGQTGSREVLRALVTTVRIPNAGLSKQRSCGDAPIFGQGVTAAWVPATSNVHLTWTPATDENSGETDVERYLIYKRTQAGAFDDALASIPAGQAIYVFDDSAVLPESTYVYGVTALDCTPLESSMSASNAVLIP